MGGAHCLIIAVEQYKPEATVFGYEHKAENSKPK